MKKDFDCVEMKNRIQEKMLEEEKRLGAEEMRRRRAEWLRQGDDELARMWRRLAVRRREDEPAALVREEPPDWNTETKP